MPPVDTISRSAGSLASLRDLVRGAARPNPQARTRNLHVSRVAYILILLFCFALPAVAQASPGAVIQDCAEDGDLDGRYSNSDLEQAQNQLPSDLDEYSDCREVIAGAVTSGSDGGRGRDNPVPTAAAAAKAERKARRADRAALPKSSKGKPKLEIGGTTVEPGSNGLFNLSSAENGLPLPLLLALIACALLAVGGALLALRRRIPLLARLPLPSIDLSRVPFPRRR